MKQVFYFSYNLQNSSITIYEKHCESYLLSLSFSAKYENFNLIADFSATEFDTSVENFCDIYSFKRFDRD